MPETPINIYHIVLAIQRDHFKKNLMQNLRKIYTKTHQNAHYFKIFLLGACPLACVQLISIFLYTNSHFSFRILSKYTLKRINYKMFSKNFSENYNQPHSKRVAIIIIFYTKIC